MEHRWLEYVVERAVPNRERPARRAREGAAPVEGIPRLVHGAHDRREEKLPTESACESEGAPELRELVLDEAYVVTRRVGRMHATGGREERLGYVRLVAKQPARWVVVGWRVFPQHRLTEPPSLAIGAAVLERRVHLRMRGPIRGHQKSNQRPSEVQSDIIRG